MTRVTNFGRKRTYLESCAESQVKGGESPETPETPDVDSAPPPKKKRKRTPKSKRDGHGTRPMGTAPDYEEGKNNSPSEETEAKLPPSKSSNTKGKKTKERRDKKYVSPSERRRLQRIAEKNANTTCFACREKGHAARDCPTNENGDAESKPVGMCYRCGSTRHTLSRCKKPEDPLNPLPHASCFVCNTKGHLASACPQNKSKGIYPDGGSCKLCGDITHLAKDCGIRKKDTGSLAAVLGIDVDAKDVGADEDDFHLIGRRKQHLDRSDQHIEKVQRSMDVKVGAQSGIVKPFGKMPEAAKKVVFF